MTDDLSAQHNTGEIPPPDPRNVRLLKTVVIVLGVLLVLGTVVLISAIVYRASKLSSKATGISGFEITEQLPPGSQIVSTQHVGDRISVRVKTTTGERIVVFDIRKGRRVGAIEFK